MKETYDTYGQYVYDLLSRTKTLLVSKRIYTDNVKFAADQVNIVSQVHFIIKDQVLVNDTQNKEILKTILLRDIKNLQFAHKLNSHAILASKD